MAIPRGGVIIGRVFLGIAPWLRSLAGDPGGCQKGGVTVTKMDKHSAETRTGAD